MRPKEAAKRADEGEYRALLFGPYGPYIFNV